MAFLISRQKGAGVWLESWLSKIDSNWRKHCGCCWFVIKWLSICIKNDSKIFEHPQDCKSSDSERELGKEEVMCTFCSTLLATWTKRKSGLILTKHYREGRCRQIFNNIIAGEETWCFAFDPKQIDIFLNEMMRHFLGRRNFKGPTSRKCL